MLPMILTEVQVVIIYFFSDKYSYIDQSILGIVLQFIILYEYASCNSGFHQLGHIATTKFIEGLHEMNTRLDPP